jgi:hypothetical protein
METFKVIRPSADSNMIVEKLYCNVNTPSFPSTKGIHKADLYWGRNSADLVVYHGSCPPVNMKFIKTVLIEF